MSTARALHILKEEPLMAEVTCCLRRRVAEDTLPSDDEPTAVSARLTSTENYRGQRSVMDVFQRYRRRVSGARSRLCDKNPFLPPAAVCTDAEWPPRYAGRFTCKLPFRVSRVNRALSTGILSNMQFLSDGDVAAGCATARRHCVACAYKAVTPAPTEIRKVKRRRTSQKLLVTKTTCHRPSVEVCPNLAEFPKRALSLHNTAVGRQAMLARQKLHRIVRNLRMGARKRGVKGPSATDDDSSGDYFKFSISNSRLVDTPEASPHHGLMYSLTHEVGARRSILQQERWSPLIPMLDIFLEGEEQPVLRLQNCVHPLDSVDTLRRLIDAELSKLPGGCTIVKESNWTFTELHPPLFRWLEQLLVDFESYYSDLEHLRYVGAEAKEMRLTVLRHREQAVMLRRHIRSLRYALETEANVASLCALIAMPATVLQRAGGGPPQGFFRDGCAPVLAPVRGRHIFPMERSVVRGMIRPVAGAALAQMDRLIHEKATGMRKPPPIDCGLQSFKPSIHRVSRKSHVALRRLRAKKSYEADGLVGMLTGLLTSAVGHVDMLLPKIVIKPNRPTQQWEESDMRVSEIERICCFSAKQDADDAGEDDDPVLDEDATLNILLGPNHGGIRSPTVSPERGRSPTQRSPSSAASRRSSAWSTPDKAALSTQPPQFMSLTVEDELQGLLADGTTPLHKRDALGWSFLDHAVWLRKPKLVDMLCKAGVSPAHGDTTNGDTVLHRLIKAGPCRRTRLDVECLKTILEQSRPDQLVLLLNHLNFQNQTPLSLAICSGDFVIIQALYNAAESPRCRSYLKGSFPSPLEERLLERVCSWERLIDTCSLQQLHWVEKHTLTDPSCALPGDLSGFTILHRALLAGSFANRSLRSGNRLLLQHPSRVLERVDEVILWCVGRVDPMSKDANGRTAFHIAARVGALKWLMPFLDYVHQRAASAFGFAKSLTTTRDFNRSRQSTVSSHAGAATSAKSVVQCSDALGNTLFHTMLESCRLMEAIEKDGVAFLAHQAVLPHVPMNHVNAQGDTLLHLVMKRRVTCFLEPLCRTLKYEASSTIQTLFTIRNADGDTILGCALRAQFTEGVRLLLSMENVAEVALPSDNSGQRRPLLLAVDVLVSKSCFVPDNSHAFRLMDQRPHCKARVNDDCLSLLLQAATAYHLSDRLVGERSGGIRGETALHAAVRGGLWHTTALLLSFGANPNYPNAAGDVTSMTLALAHPTDVSLARLLLANDTSDWTTGQTLLTCLRARGACAASRDFMREYFLGRLPYDWKASSVGSDAMLAALETGNVTMLEELTELGAELREPLVGIDSLLDRFLSAIAMDRGAKIRLSPGDAPFFFFHEFGIQTLAYRERLESVLVKMFALYLSHANRSRAPTVDLWSRLIVKAIRADFVELVSALWTVLSVMESSDALANLGYVPDATVAVPYHALPPKSATHQRLTCPFAEACRSESWPQWPAHLRYAFTAAAARAALVTPQLTPAPLASGVRLCLRGALGMIRQRSCLERLLLLRFAAADMTELPQTIFAAVVDCSICLPSPLPVAHRRQNQGEAAIEWCLRRIRQRSSVFISLAFLEPQAEVLMALLRLRDFIPLSDVLMNQSTPLSDPIATGALGRKRLQWCIADASRKGRSPTLLSPLTLISHADSPIVGILWEGVTRGPGLSRLYREAFLSALHFGHFSAAHSMLDSVRRLDSDLGDDDERTPLCVLLGSELAKLKTIGELPLIAIVVVEVLRLSQGQAPASLAHLFLRSMEAAVCGPQLRKREIRRRSIAFWDSVLTLLCGVRPALAADAPRATPAAKSRSTFPTPSSLSSVFNLSPSLVAVSPSQGSITNFDVSPFSVPSASAEVTADDAALVESIDVLCRYFDQEHVSSISTTSSPPRLLLASLLQPSAMEMMVNLGLSQTLRTIVQKWQTLDSSTRPFLSHMQMPFGGHLLLSALIQRPSSEIPSSFVNDVLRVARDERQEWRNGCRWIEHLLGVYHPNNIRRVPAATRQKLPVLAMMRDVARTDPATGRDVATGSTALHDTVWTNRVDVAVAILSAQNNELDVDVTAEAFNQMTPIAAACKWNRLSIASQLISTGVDVLVEDNRGVACLHHAATANAVELILASEDGVDAANSRSAKAHQMAPIFYHIARCRPEVALLLLQSPASEGIDLATLRNEETGENLFHVTAKLKVEVKTDAGRASTPAKHIAIQLLEHLLQVLPRRLLAEADVSGLLPRDCCAPRGPLDALFAASGAPRRLRLWPEGRYSIGIRQQRRLRSLIPAKLGITIDNEDAWRRMLRFHERPSEMSPSALDGGITVDESAWDLASEGRDAELLSLLEMGATDMKCVRFYGVPLPRSEGDKRNLLRDLTQTVQTRFGGFRGTCQLVVPQSDGPPSGSAESPVTGAFDTLTSGENQETLFLKQCGISDTRAPYIAAQMIDEDRIPAMLAAGNIMLKSQLLSVIREPPRGPSYRLPQCRPKGTTSLLHEICRTGCLRSLDFVLRNNSSQGSPNSLLCNLLTSDWDDGGLSAFHIAVVNRQWPIVVELLRARVPIHAGAGPMRSITPLQMFSCDLQIGIVQWRNGGQLPNHPKPYFDVLQEIGEYLPKSCRSRRLDSLADSQAAAYAFVRTTAGPALVTRMQRVVLTSILDHLVPAASQRVLRNLTQQFLKRSKHFLTDTHVEKVRASMSQLRRDTAAHLGHSMQLHVDFNGADAKDNAAERERTKAVMLYHVEGGVIQRLIETVVLDGLLLPHDCDTPFYGWCALPALSEIILECVAIPATGSRRDATQPTPSPQLEAVSSGSSQLRLRVPFYISEDNALFINGDPVALIRTFFCMPYIDAALSVRKALRRLSLRYRCFEQASEPLSVTVAVADELVSNVIQLAERVETGHFVGGTATEDSAKDCWQRLRRQFEHLASEVPSVSEADGSAAVMDISSPLGRAVQIMYELPSIIEKRLLRDAFPASRPKGWGAKACGTVADISELGCILLPVTCTRIHLLLYDETNDMHTREVEVQSAAEISSFRGLDCLRRNIKGSGSSQGLRQLLRARHQAKNESHVLLTCAVSRLSATGILTCSSDTSGLRVQRRRLYRGSQFNSSTLSKYQWHDYSIGRGHQQGHDSTEVPLIEEGMNRSASDPLTLVRPESVLLGIDTSSMTTELPTQTQVTKSYECTMEGITAWVRGVGGELRRALSSMAQCVPRRCRDSGLGSSAPALGGHLSRLPPRTPPGCGRPAVLFEQSRQKHQRFCDVLQLVAPFLMHIPTLWRGVRSVNRRCHDAVLDLFLSPNENYLDGLIATIGKQLTALSARLLQRARQQGDGGRQGSNAINGGSATTVCRLLGGSHLTCATSHESIRQVVELRHGSRSECKMAHILFFQIFLRKPLIAFALALSGGNPPEARFVLQGPSSDHSDARLVLSVFETLSGAFWMATHCDAMLRRLDGSAMMTRRCESLASHAPVVLCDREPNTVDAAAAAIAANKW